MSRSKHTPPQLQKPVREIIAVFSETHTKHSNVVCAQNIELLNAKLVVHIVTTGL
jgi:hypothetical protein